MKDIADKNFGVIIAFWLPGFLLLWGLSYSSPELAFWLNKSNGPDAPTIGNFLYASLASLAAGLLVSAIRWLFVDHFFWACGCFIGGLKRPALDMGPLAEEGTLAAFSGAVEHHYRYYQYYSNTLVAIIIGYIAYVGASKGGWLTKLTIIIVIIGIALLLASGDCLRKYHNAALQILSHTKGKTHDKRLARQEGREEEGEREEGGGKEEGGRKEGSGKEEGRGKEEGLSQPEGSQINV